MSQQREGREWIILLAEYDEEEDFREAVARELASLENMGHRLGRGFVVTPLRQGREIANVMIYETVGWAFRETFMPAVGAAPTLEVKQAPAPEAEPVAV